MKTSLAIKADAIAACFFALGSMWFILHVGAGMFVGVIGMLYFAPVSLLFAAASLALYRRWRLSKSLHWIAVACAAIPPLAAAVVLSFQ